MSRTELYKYLLSLDENTIKVLMVYIFFKPPITKKKIIEAITTVCNDQEINNGLYQLGVEKRIS